jgi:hypoxanthine phosphoribosyltransferase
MPRPTGKKPVRSSPRSRRARSSRFKVEPLAVPAEVQAVRRAARRLYSPREVARALDTMADELAPRLRGTNPVVLAVMHGGAYAALELCKRFDFPHEFDYVHVTRYRGATRGGDVEWRVRPRAALAGRTVLVVDDILDRGKTLRVLDAELKRLGVRDRLTAVLVVKRLARRALWRATVVGLAVDDVYVFGSGMDYRGYWRELAGIYAVAET